MIRESKKAKCPSMLIKKSGKRPMTEGTELPNQRKIRTLGEKETYKYLRILEADTIKKIIKENLRGTINNSKPNYIVEISSKG